MYFRQRALPRSYMNKRLIALPLYIQMANVRGRMLGGEYQRANVKRQNIQLGANDPSLEQESSG